MTLTLTLTSIITILVSKRMRWLSICYLLVERRTGPSRPAFAFLRSIHEYPVYADGLPGRSRAQLRTVPRAAKPAAMAMAR